MKTCSLCEQEKDNSCFYVRKNKNNILYSYCKDCCKIRRNQYYEQDKSRYKIYDKAKREDLAKKVIEYLLSHPCVDCGCTDALVLDFDHVRGQKENGISRLVTSKAAWHSIEQEISKCEVRCANCHRIRHAKISNSKVYRLLKEIGTIIAE